MPGRILITAPVSGAAITAAWIVVKSAPVAPTVIVFGSCPHETPHATFKTTIARLNLRQSAIISPSTWSPVGHLFDTNDPTKTILNIDTTLKGPNHREPCFRAVR